MSTDPKTLLAEGAAVLTTAEGKTVAFTGVVAKFVVAHPRLSTLAALLLGGVIGHLV